MRQLKLSEAGETARDTAAASAGSLAGTGRALTRDDILSAVEVAELLQLRRSTVEDYARRGVLPSIKLGRFRRFVRADIEHALARLRDGGSAYSG
jgi:excisionase family DNA binding protein